MEKSPNTRASSVSRRKAPGIHKKGTSPRVNPKSLAACLTCRSKKVKCSGSSPCTYCTKRNLTCEIPEAGQRRVYSVTRIQDLESRLSRYENPRVPRIEDGGAGTSTNHERDPRKSGTSSMAGPNDNVCNALLSEPLELSGHPMNKNSSKTGTEELRDKSLGRAIVTDSTLSSSFNFGSVVRKLLEGSKPPHRREEEKTVHDHTLIPQPGPMSVFELPSLPTEKEAFSLLETFVIFIGHTQNLIDFRDLSDRIGLMYRLSSRHTYQENLYTLEVLLVCAIGRLFRGDFGATGSTQDEFPGYSLFQPVLDRVPSLSRLYSVGRVGVEVVALVAVYLQNINRKEEAYLYISTACRLAISNGYHRNNSRLGLLQSEATHINRLWWSIYLQERRLAAATGNPSGIRDAVAEHELPSNSIGFTPAAPMRTSIKLARVYGDIITILYDTTPQAENTFVSNVQHIIKDLTEISGEIPVQLDTGLPGLGHDESLRTSVTLHLMFYQALLLTIRPVMLHVAQLVLSGTPLPPDFLISSPLGKLCRTCTEAARKLLKDLITLRGKKLIAMFGFFDFDAMISVSFIMMLTSVIDSACDQSKRLNPSPGLDEALQLVEFMASHGNRFAAGWLHDIRQTYDHLRARLTNPYPHQNEEDISMSTTLNEQTSSATPVPITPSASSEITGTHNVIDPPNARLEVSHPDQQSILSDLDLWDGINDFWAPSPQLWEAFQNDSSCLPFASFQDLYANPHWTPEVQDWREGP